MARSLNGTTEKISYGDIAALDGLANLTVCLWVKMLTLEDFAGLAVKYTSNTSGGWGIICGGSGAGDNNDLFGFIRTAGDAGNYGYTSGNLLATNAWNHIALVYDGAGSGNSGKQQIYFNGVSQSLTFFGTVPTSCGTNSDAVELGVITSIFAHCALADFRVFTVTLTPTEIVAVKQDKIVRPNSCQIWSQLWGNASPEPDMSGNGHTGTLTGTAQTDHPPLPLPFTRRRRVWSGIAAAAAGPHRGSLLLAGVGR
jgi:hypothetical protein